ncbi:glycosyltransferase family 4 protein [Phocea massiliensis]|uniref:Glycosyltransferase family 4 protein n=1 Tax=Merdimmobilis hominis TaxID=2897707 RepID=A0A938X6S4_9FIRM|nr:glycosyltransferase family 4 protein [Merdimmobilis hominis]MBM6920226.1 glycosyltransferase family 4 protein [Merdimmobilis hominis]
MILVLTNNYPSEDNLYANGFVHTRVLGYLKKGIEVEVFVCKKNMGQTTYTYQGVSVVTGSANDLKTYLEEHQVEKICIHFLSPEMIKGMDRVKKQFDLFIFVHGNEALFWYERLFRSTTSSIHNFLVYCHNAVFNTLSIFNIRRFLRKTKNCLHFITVSEWMMRKTCKNWKVDESRFTIIPNYINEEVFFSKRKSEADRLKILSIRPYSSSKYANDMSMDFIQKLSQYDFFSQLEIKIVGKGNMFAELTSKVSMFPNVLIENRFLNQEQIKSYHDEYGIFLCPTRQDAQGVSMCEAMSSGLVPLTLNNTAIPEFVKEQEILSCDTDDMVQKFVYLYNHPSLYTELSEKISKEIQEQCGYEKTITKEIQLVAGE